MFFRRRIHAIKAWRDRRWTGNPHVNFLRAGIADQADNLLAGGAAHDRIVNQGNALPVEQAAHRIELQFDAEITHRLARLDERSSNVVIAYQAEAERYPA